MNTTQILTIAQTVNPFWFVFVIAGVTGLVSAYRILNTRVR